MSFDRQLALGARIREARLSSGETAEHVAAALNVSASTILNIEGGKTAPSVRLLHCIVEHLSVDIRSFFSADPPDENAAASSFLQKYSAQLDDEDWRALITVARALIAKSTGQT